MAFMGHINSNNLLICPSGHKLDQRFFFFFLYLVTLGIKLNTYEPPHDKTQQNGMCAQRRLRSAWASAQSDQSLCCLHKERMCP